MPLLCIHDIRLVYTLYKLKYVNKIFMLLMDEAGQVGESTNSHCRFRATYYIGQAGLDYLFIIKMNFISMYITY